MQASDLVALQRSAATIHVDDAVAAYIVELVRRTRAWNGIDVGAGASIAMLRAARAQALLNGHDFVTPDDVKSIAPGVLRHRIALSADLEIEGYRTDDVVRDLPSKSQRRVNDAIALWHLCSAGTDTPGITCIL